MSATNPRKPQPDRIPEAGLTDPNEEPRIDLSSFVAQNGSVAAPGEARLTDLDLNDAVVVRDDERDDDLGGTAVRVPYTNDVGQDFTVTAIAANEERAREELAVHQVYLGAFPLDEPHEASDEATPWIEDSVSDLTVKSMNARFAQRNYAEISLDDVIAVRDRNSANHSPTLEQIVQAYGLDPESVFSDVVTEAQSRYLSIEPRAVESTVHAIRTQPDVPFIDSVYNASTDERADERIRAELAADNSGIVIIEVSVTNPRLDGGSSKSPPRTRPLTIIFAFDPILHKEPRDPYVRHYKAKRQTSARAQLNHRAGKMTLFMWQKTPVHDGLGSRTASESNKTTSPIYGHGGTSYDIRVVGRRDNSRYGVGGSWELGFGWA